MTVSRKWCCIHSPPQGVSTECVTPHEDVHQTVGGERKWDSLGCLDKKDLARGMNLICGSDLAVLIAPPVFLAGIGRGLGYANRFRAEFGSALW